MTMCEGCGCEKEDLNVEEGKPEEKKTVHINKSINEANDIIAKEISGLLGSKGILCINILGSPGSGKTTFIENVSRDLGTADVAVIQGDLESDIDKARLEKQGISSAQINTHSGCHLNASMVHKAIFDLDLRNKKYLMIENVGNLVCPAGVMIGQHLNILISSTAEGSDKPRKYPLMFRDADMIAISKTDLSAHVGFDEKNYTHDLMRISPKARIIKTTVKDSSSFGSAAHFLEHEREHLLGKHHHH